MKIYKLNKTVLRFKNNVVEFLNGLTSNELDKPNNAFCSIHGRVIATFDQIKIADDEFLVCIEQPFVQETLTHLERYAKLSGVQIIKMNYNVYFDLESSCAIEAEQWVIAQKSGQLIITARELEQTISEEDFTRFRLENHIPIQGVDYQHELLLNISTTEFISFTKGCFLGQEPISKVYNRSKPSWKLVVKHEDECSAEEVQKMTSRVEVDGGRVLGFVFVKNE